MVKGDEMRNLKYTRLLLLFITIYYYFPTENNNKVKYNAKKKTPRTS